MKVHTARTVTGLVMGTLLVCGWTMSAGAAPITIEHGESSVDMDFTLIDNPSNGADDTGFGSVGYEYQVGTYEVSKNQWDIVVSADSNLTEAGGWSGNQPVAEVRHVDAAMYCNWLTSGDALTGAYAINGVEVSLVGREDLVGTYDAVYVLPTENEWYKAAYYDSQNDLYYTYGTGSNTMPTPTTGSTNPDEAVYRLAQDFPEETTDPALIDFAGGLSAYGTMGQSGNVAEYLETLGNNTPLHRGGHYSDGGATNLSADTTAGTNSSQYSTPSTVGFRVVRLVPEPSSLILLILGASMVLSRRRASSSR